MFTVCSKCNLRLTVTATDLRAAQGYVRCGRCQNVFNALAALADDPARQGEAEGTAAAAPSAPAPPQPPTPERTAPATASEDLSPTDTSLEFNPASTNINEVFIEAAPRDRTGTFESIILSGEAPESADAEPAPVMAPQALSTPPEAESDIEAQHRHDLPEPATPVDQAPAMDPWSLPAPRAMEAAELAADSPERAETADGLLQAPPAASRPSRWGMRGVAATLTLCLIAQVIYHYRGELAGTSVFHRPLTAICAALGQPLEPHWDITKYDVRQLGATTDGAAPGDLVVRASIANRAQHDQPLPLLRVVMQDRFGNRLAARDLKPAEYLGPGAPPVSLMAPGQRVDAQVAFRDPGQTASGFEIDACMDRHDHTVICANDPGSH